MDARTPNPTSMRVLIRPPIPASLPPPIPPPVPPNPHSSSSPPPPPPTPPSSQDGVVVVGFIGKRDGDVAQLIDRIIDANVFGSGGFDKTFVIDSNEIYDKVRDWFKYRRISYFHEEEKGILYLKFCWTRCPAMEDFVESRLGFDSVLEDSDFETLQGMLFMFSVTPPFPVLLATCPVIQFEASCLPPSILDREQKLQFSIGCQVILPPESFLSLRLPFVYGVQLDDGSLHPLKPFENQPELTAWITKGTMLQILSNGREIDEAVLT